MSEEIILYGVGDIIPDRENTESIFEQVRGLINMGDIAFCQLESVLSEGGTPLPQARLVARGKPDIAPALKKCGFDVVSFASNHCMDLGQEAFLETLAHLNQQSLAVIGVGENITDARQPAVIDCRGTKVAFLAYNTILPQAYWATAERPGCVPLRAFTVYEQVEQDQPGTPCRIHTYPHRDDLAAMTADIQQAKTKADVVIVSMHWGIHFVPAVLADYQRDMAYAAIEAGADLILGHHAHILKGIEVYKGKVIFYSLGNFALDLAAPKALLESESHQEINKLNPDWVFDPEYPTYYMPRDSRKTMIAKCLIADKKVKAVSFLPAYINKQSQPEVVGAGDGRFQELLAYVEEITADQGLTATFTVQGDEVLIH